MITCQLLGGLGNQLFQIFTTIAFSFRNSTPFFFFNIEQIGDGSNNITIRYTYWNTFLKDLQIYIKDINTQQYLLNNYILLKEIGFRFDPALIHGSSTQTYLLYGYFQSYKYFEHYKNTIFKMIKLQEQKNYLLNTKLKPFNIDLSDTVSLHFRQGDYKLLPNIYPILGGTYYYNSLKTLLNMSDTTIKSALCFCESHDFDNVNNIVEKLKSEFPDIQFQFAFKELEDWEQMLLMSMCKYNIIANSSFSWWSAYFNTNDNKKICYPSKWFQESVNKSTIDLFKLEWLNIDIDKTI
jgi:hypothetical protein